ncbi:MAG TPA: site-specific integrase [Nitrososphaeraceae archaeon]|nr:site-specific integrase [Nitrososphaeraceae archaeon]
MPFSTGLHINSQSIAKFIKNIGIQNKNTAIQYQSRLSFFERFAKDYYKDNKSNVDELLLDLKDKKLDPYDILNEFSLFLKNNYNFSGATFKAKITTIKTFLEYFDIDISPKKFKLKVRIPKKITSHKEAIDKEDIIKILNGCSDLRLKTYVMLLASTGCRATEALSIRIKDIDFESNPAKIGIRGEYTKTKVDRYTFITNEVVEQIKLWLDFKYRKRRICKIDKETGKTITEYRIPEKDTNDLIFSIYRVKNPYPESLYNSIERVFAKTLDRIGMGSREDGNEIRREITLHSFRRFAKTTISNLGFQDYSDWFLGHAGSTYWREKDKVKAEIFKKVEPYLTFLDINQLERQGSDMQTKIEELQQVNQHLLNEQVKRDKQIEELNSQVKNIDTIIGERFSELFQQYGLVDYTLVNKNKKEST